MFNEFTTIFSIYPYHFVVATFWHNIGKLSQNFLFMKMFSPDTKSICAYFSSVMQMQRFLLVI